MIQAFIAYLAGLFPQRNALSAAAVASPARKYPLPVDVDEFVARFRQGEDGPAMEEVAAVLGDRAARALAAEAAAAGVPAWRVASAARLLPVCGDPLAVERLTRLAEHPAPEVRAATAGALGRVGAVGGTGDADVGDDVGAGGEIGSPGATVALLLGRLLRHENVDVRWRAATAIGDRRETRCVDDLLARLNVEREEAVAASLCWALGEMRVARAVAPLADLARGVGAPAGAAGANAPASTAVRAAAADALGRIGERSAAPAVASLLYEQNPVLRAEAIHPLRLLTGLDLGDDTQTWLAWWSEHYHEFFAGRVGRIRQPGRLVFAGAC
ncbi:MAG: HEAT repeat domain-containing protein [Planctomycetes bacterium]|nr:HEAT repeat domain-containing protein [Planctomycetota bacterium]